jgi:1-deoxy-D-xylulose 5-phosphate reductoisomerase
VVERVLERTPTSPLGSIDDVLAADRQARHVAEEFICSSRARGKKRGK